MPLTQKIGPLFSDESNNNDAAKDARRLFDTIAVCENISVALSEFVDKYAQRLPKCAVRDIRLLSEGARCFGPVPVVLKEQNRQLVCLER